MIQIEMISCVGTPLMDSVDQATHRCLVTLDNERVGTMDLSVSQTHGRILETKIRQEDLEYLDGLVKTAMHQLYWKGIRTCSYLLKDSELVHYFSRFQVPCENDGEECRFDLEDFIDAARCKHG